MSIRDFDDPIPPDVIGLDLITFFFAYHDVTYMQVDRAVMNKKMFAALKPGGFLVIADHSAKPATASALPRPCIASRRARCARKSRPPVSSSSPKATSCAIPKIPRDAAVFRPQVPNDEFVLKYQKPL